MAKQSGASSQGLSPPADRVFVGRTEELALIAGLARRAADGEPAMVLIRGEPGIGKTALLHTCIGRLRGFRVLNATADRHETDYPGAVLTQLLSALDADAVRSHPHLSPDAGRTTPFAAGVQLLSLMGELQAHGPVAISVDDLQWIDDFSLRVLLFMWRRLRVDNVISVLTARHETQNSNLADVVSFVRASPGAEEIEVTGLRCAETAELARAVLGEDLPHADVSRLQEQTGGHAMFARTLLTEMPLESLRSGDRLAVPPSLSSAIYQLLAALPPDARGLIDALAVLDAATPLPRVAQLAELPSAEAVARALDAAVQTGLAEWWPLEPTTPVALRHSLQREAVYGLMPAQRRHALHSRAADIVHGAAAWGHRVAAAAGPDAVLADELERLATEESALGKHAMAGTHLLWASELSGTRGVRERRFLSAALESIAANQVVRVLRRKSDIEACESHFNRDLILLALHIFTGEHEHAGRISKQLFAELKNATERSDIAIQAGYLLPWGLLVSGAAREAIEAAHLILDNPGTDPLTASSAWPLVSGAVATLEGPAEALRSLASMPGPDPKASAEHPDALGTRGVWRVIEGDLTSGLADLRLAMKSAREGAPVTGCRRMWGYAAWGHFLLGDWDESLLLAETAVDEALAGGYAFDYPFEQLIRIFVPAARGDVDLAGRLLGEMAEAGGEAGALLHATGKALLAQATSDYPAMYAALCPWHDESPDHIDIVMTERWWRPLLAEAEVGTGRFDMAEETLERLAPTSYVPYLRMQVAQLRGRLLEGRGRRSAALAAYQEALGAPPSENDSAPFRGLTHLHAGRLLLEDGHRRPAADHLRSAHGTLTRLRAAPGVRLCESLLARCGVRSTAGTGIGADQLTEREREIARYVGLGTTNREIAENLYISPKTVEFHLGRVYTKLGLDGRKELRRNLQAGHLEL
ncbi:AAA family ATPase [Streptomyces sp. NPDC048514]|uniref:helix-turn-helix transcriptional regulator n=1 Tax=Streptomyces sp. NPDC048514 TaxID=3365564 RepID=UPI0037160524